MVLLSLQGKLLNHCKLQSHHLQEWRAQFYLKITVRMKATVTNVANITAGGEQQTWRTIVVATVGVRLDFTLETPILLLISKRISGGGGMCLNNCTWKLRQKGQRKILAENNSQFLKQKERKGSHPKPLLFYPSPLYFISLFKFLLFLTLFLYHRLNFLFPSSLIFIKSRSEVQIHLELCKWITEASYCALSPQNAVFAY